MVDLGDFTTIKMDGREARNNPGLEDLFMENEYNVEIVENMENVAPFDFIQDTRDKVGIERKRIDDFMKSVRGGRHSKDHIWDQCNRMVNSDYYSYIIVEGNPYNYPRMRWNTREFYGAMASISVRYRIPVLWVGADHPDPRQAMEEFAYQAGKIFKSHREGKAGQGRDRKVTYVDPDISMAAQILSLCGLDKKAVMVAEELALIDVMDIITLTTGQLKSVEGIGPKIAERIMTKLGIRGPL